MSQDNKTEQATPKKRRDERKKGNIFQSKDLTVAASIFVGFYGLLFFFPFLYEQMGNYLHRTISRGKDLSQLSVADAHVILQEVVVQVLLLSLPLLLIGLLGNLAISVAQTKLLFTWDAIKFKASKLNPIQGIKRIISLRSLVELIKSLLKIVIIIALIYSICKDFVYSVPRLMDVDLLSAVSFVGDTIMSLVFRIGIVFLGLGILDYFYQRWEYEKNIKMSKDEVKREYKQMEGDPMLKGKRREMQRQIGMRRMMQAVPDADVVIRNPTHFAVALSYKGNNNQAPIVVAKGQDYVALKIIELAEANGVAITENRPLARTLYSTVEVGQEISPEYYQAVAEVLAWVYSLNKERKRT